MGKKSRQKKDRRKLWAAERQTIQDNQVVADSYDSNYLSVVDPSLLLKEIFGTSALESAQKCIDNDRDALQESIDKEIIRNFSACMPKRNVIRDAETIRRMKRHW